MRGIFAAVSLSAVATVLATPVAAQEVVSGDDAVVQDAESTDGNEIFVTARKRAESVQKVPISISVTTGVEIIESGVRGLEELSQTLPGVNISKGGASDQLFIRGIGSGFNSGFEQAVGTYVDGVYLGRSRNTRAAFLDVARLEVLKGPQTTFFGNSSIGGALSITSQDPGYDFGGNASAVFIPRFGETDFNAALDLPVTERLRFRVAGRKFDSQGFYEETVPGAPDLGTANDWAMRVTGIFEASEDFEVKIKYATGETRANGAFAGDVFACPLPANFALAPNGQAGRPCAVNLAAFPTGDPRRFDNAIDFRSQSPADEPTRSDFQSLNATIKIGLGAVTLTSVTGWNSFNFSESQDLDQTVQVVFVANQIDNFDAFSQELRFDGSIGDNIDWIVGGYFQNEDIFFQGGFSPLFIPPVNSQRTPTTMIGNFTIDTSNHKTYSFFSSGVFRVSDSFRINAGLRYTKVDKRLTNENFWATFPSTTGVLRDPNTLTRTNFAFPGFAIANTPVTGEVSDDAWLPSFGVELDVGEDGLLYASYTRGFKAGGFPFSERFIFNDNPATPVVGDSNINSFGFGPERANAYEAGFKGTWLNGALKTNLTLFWSDYTGVQQSVINPDTFVFAVQNAAASRARGVEMELGYELTRGLTLSADVTLLDAEFRDFVGQCSEFQNQTRTCPNTGGVNGAQDLSGSETTFAPSYAGNLRAAYETQIGDWKLNFDTSLFFTDGFFIQSDFDPFNFVEDYVLWNARIAIAPPPLGNLDWEFAILGRNLGGATYSTFCNDLTGSPGSYRCSLAPPRSIGAQVSFKW